MNKIKNIFTFVIFLFLVYPLKGQNKHADFANENLLHTAFDKLYSLKEGNWEKVNIVHIGDSHIQADFFTNVVRQELQLYFGDGGYGFTFPYSIAKTNGTRLIKYTTNTEWETARNIDRSPQIPIGLGGIGLSTNDKNFFISLSADNSCSFNIIKAISANKNSCFSLSQNITQSSPSTVRQVSKETYSNSYTYHTVKSNETLYRLSVNYKVSVDEIKKANNLKSNTIRVGQKVRIPQKKKASNNTIVSYSEDISATDSLQLIFGDYYTEFHSPTEMNEITILADKEYQSFDLNGIVLEKDSPGILYHSIGINGAKASDFNKYPLFFNQLQILKPDIVIISLGTNESFGKLSTSGFIHQMKLLIKNIRQNNAGIPIIITTPPPSLLKRRLSNTLLVDYNTALKKLDDCTVWDLHSKMGGTEAPKRKNNQNLIAKDKVHYTKEGYQMQGEMFANDLLNSYVNYIKYKKSSDGHDIREVEQTGH